MKTLFCPECKYPLKTVFKQGFFSGWLRCPRCEEPSYALVTEDGTSAIRSIAQYISVLDDSGRGVLDYLLKKNNEQLPLRELVFMVGKRAEFAIEEMAEAQVLERYGPYYYIRPDIVDAIRKALYKQ